MFFSKKGMGIVIMIYDIYDIYIYAIYAIYDYIYSIIYKMINITIYNLYNIRYNYIYIYHQQRKYGSMCEFFASPVMVIK